MLTTYSETLRVQYKSSWISKATCFNFIILMTSLILPYLMIYRAQGLWVRLTRFREQPKVLFKHEALVVLETADFAGSSGSLVWTTFPGLASMLDKDLPTLLASREADTNFDTIPDYLDIEISIPLSQNTTVYGVHVILLFEYRLSQYAIMDMESMIFASHQAGRKGSRYEFYGDLSLVQKDPLWNRVVDKRYNVPVVPRSSLTLEDYSIQSIIKKYSYRNVSTILAHKYDIWLSNENHNAFVIKGRINYIEETYECWSGFWEMLKWAWIQYFSAFIIVYAALKAFQSTIYKARLFDTCLIIPWDQRPKSHIRSEF